MKRTRLWIVGAVTALFMCGQVFSEELRFPRLSELMAGANGDARVQFVEIEAGPGPWSVGSARLTFFDATGRETGLYLFPTDPPSRGLFKVLVATPAFAALPGAPRPDFLMPPLVNAVSGRVCLTRPSRHPHTSTVRDCVSYGEFQAEGERPGHPAARLEIVNTYSLRRQDHDDSDFALSRAPTPTNAAGRTFTLAVAPVVAQGNTLFNRETFQGNGRTCSTCHEAQNSFGLGTGSVKARFASLVQTYDPLFIAETVNFDFNLNTLTLTQRSAPADLSGTIRGTTGVARVLTRIGPTTYLVYGGMSPQLSGTVTDGTSSAAVSAVTPGDLDRLEDPAKMRLPVSDLPPELGFIRSLILENIGGVDEPHVFRKSPHLLNLARTAPFGLSGTFEDLRGFSRQAVLQHFPRSLARVENVDFRFPTDRELRALEAFQRSIEFPAGNDPDKLNLDRFATTTSQRIGRQVFFGPVAKCSKCHSGPLLNETDGTVGKPPGLASFNTGVSAQLFNDQDGLPQEPGVDGSLNGREFNVPSLFNAKNTVPLFHDGSGRTLTGAILFYEDVDFNDSPAAAATGRITFNPLSDAEFFGLFDFVRGLVVRPYTLTGGPLDFGSQVVTQAPPGPRTIVITNPSNAPIQFQPVTGSGFCSITGPNKDDFEIVSCPLDTPLLPGESRTLSVVFAPLSVGLKNAVLEINATDPSGVDLSGNGVRVLPTQ